MDSQPTLISSDCTTCFPVLQSTPGRRCTVTQTRPMPNSDTSEILVWTHFVVGYTPFVFHEMLFFPLHCPPSGQTAEMNYQLLKEHLWGKMAKETCAYKTMMCYFPPVKLHFCWEKCIPKREAENITFLVENAAESHLQKNHSFDEFLSVWAWSHAAETGRIRRVLWAALAVCLPPRS